MGDTENLTLEQAAESAFDTTEPTTDVVVAPPEEGNPKDTSISEESTPALTTEAKTETSPTEAPATTPSPETIPETPPIDYQAQLTQTQQALQQMAAMAQNGQGSQVLAMLGVKDVQQPIEEQTPQEDPMAALSKSFGFEGEEAKLLTNAIQNQVNSALGTIQKENSDLRAGIKHLMNKDANTELTRLRAIPGFQQVEGKVGELLRRAPGLTPEEAFKLMNSETAIKQAKVNGIEAYKASITGKIGASDVIQPGDVSNTMPSEKIYLGNKGLDNCISDVIDGLLH